MNTANNANISTHTPYALAARGLSLFESHPHRQVREQQDFYIPELLTDPGYDAAPKTCAAFEKQAKPLHDVEGLIGDAWNLAGLMLAAMADEHDDRAMQTYTGLKVIEEKLSEAHNRIDRLHTQYTNLFLAYFDLKEKGGGKVE